MIRVELVIGGTVVMGREIDDSELSPDFARLAVEQSVEAIGELCMAEPGDVANAWERLGSPSTPRVLEEQTVHLEVEHPTAAKLVRKMRGKIAAVLRRCASLNPQAVLVWTPIHAEPLADRLNGWADEIDAGTFGA